MTDHDDSDASPDIGAPLCLNCDEALRGQYCARCGQRSTSRLISLLQLLKEAFGDLFEADSRLWRTLGPLLVRPGRLTKDYLLGRRARYMPPFRTYLVLSVVFFVVASFNPREDLEWFFEAPSVEILDADEDDDDEDAEKIAAAEAALKKLADDGTLPPDFVDNLDTTGFQIRFDGDEDGCDIEDSDLASYPEWIKKRFTKERVEQACARVKLDGGRTLGRRLIDNIPMALIVLLPIMAFVLKVLYPLSRRYFVEHLLFFVHFHAFFFLILTFQILLQRLSAMLGVPHAIPILIIVVASLYIPVYLYVAMRRVYGQGHVITTLKYIALFIAYVTGASLTLLAATAFAFFAV